MSRKSQNTIEAIIFDLGGVLLNVDYHLTIEAFEKLGYQNFGDKFSQEQQEKLFDQFEKGEIAEQDFFQALRDFLPDNFSEHAMRDAWNAMLLDFPEENLNFLKDVGRSYPVFLLSNTNETHLRAFNEILKKDLGCVSLSAFFNAVYYSHQIGMRKPDPEVFRKVLGDNGLTAYKTLFIDDTSRHVEAAKSLGLQAYLKEPSESWNEVIERYDLKVSV